jgi:2,3-bisphosphoglycerate-independent phosphoglycerate mutase
MIEREKKSGALLRDEHGVFRAKTSHSLNPVPCHLYAPSAPSLRFEPSVAAPGLGNVAATLLHLLGKAAPDGYLPSLLG